MNVMQQRKTRSIAKLSTGHNMPRTRRSMPIALQRVGQTRRPSEDSRLDVPSLVKRVQSYLDVGRT